MAATKTFPDDWSNLTDDQVMENIQYLTEYRRKYKTDVYGNETMRMGNVHIVLFTINQHNKITKIARVNNKKISNRQNRDLYNAIRSLYEMCEHDKTPFKTKFANAWEDIKMTVLVEVMIGTVIVGGVLIGACINKRQKYKKEEMVREALKLYQDAQQNGKTIVFEDVVKQVVR